MLFEEITQRNCCNQIKIQLQQIRQERKRKSNKMVMSHDFCTFKVGSIEKKTVTVRTHVKGTFNSILKLQL